MSMYDDSELSGRFAALAPEPVSGNWDEVLDRAGMARNGRQRFERSRAVPGRRRRLVVVLAALAVATAAATAGWAIVREVVLHKSFIGLPPVGATRSAPESGELVIQYWANIQGRVWVYADGRLITLGQRTDSSSSGSRPRASSSCGPRSSRQDSLDNRLYGYLHSACRAKGGLVLLRGPGANAPMQCATATGFSTSST